MLPPVKNRLVLLVLLIAVGWFLWPAAARRHPPGVLVSPTPELSMIEKGKSWNHEGYLVTPLAEYRIKARVLGRARYWTGRESDLARYDLAVGWGVMSDQKVLDQMSLSQDGRWYHYEWKGDPPADPSQMASQSKNMHIIPASVMVQRAVERVVEGDLVDLDGKLVEIKATDGWSWRSGINDSETGAHSCKLYWVETWRTL